MSILNEIRNTYGLAGDTDSYKFTHPAQYVDGADRLMSYIESRGGDYDESVFFGLQLILKEYFLDPMTHEKVDNLIKFQRAHLFGVEVEELEVALRAVVDDYDGYMPLRIKAVQEGKVVPTGNILVSVESSVADERIIALTTYMETMLMRLWHPTTVATTSYHIKKIIYDGLLKTADDADAEIPFKLHDFGSRGVEEMSGFSIPATEHSTTTSHGRHGEEDLVERMFNKFAGEGAIFATVADSYDIMNFVDNIAPKYK
jgi:nicotinamide phosphoribosyltransferase